MGNKQGMRNAVNSAWDISTGVFNQSLNPSPNITAITKVHFRSDGLKMYITGTTLDVVAEYTLSSAWDITSATYINNFNISGKQSIAYGLSISVDGLKMYITGASPTKRIDEYTLSSAWDITSATFTQTFTFGVEMSGCRGHYFKDDGLKLYLSDNAVKKFHEYDLSSAWDVSTIVFNQSFTLGAETSVTFDLYFNVDGSQVFTIDYINDKIYQYSLSTAWDISTTSYDTISLNIVLEQNGGTNLFINPDGLKLYVTGFGNNLINEYNL